MRDSQRSRAMLQRSCAAHLRRTSRRRLLLQFLLVALVFGGTQVSQLNAGIMSFELYNDTDVDGDYVTTDARVIVTLSADDSLTPVYVDFAAATESGEAFLTSAYVEGETVMVDLSSYLPFAEVEVYARLASYDWTIEDYVFSSWVPLRFTYEYENQPPFVEFSVVREECTNFWRVQVTVHDECPFGLTVTFGGVLDGHATTVLSDGTFSFSVELSPEDEGLAQAWTVDGEGLASPVAEAWVDWL